ncbi:MAG: nitroreductase family protein [Gammaproteobacteria bacterium]
MNDVDRLLRTRFSPRAFDARPIADSTLASLFEAARWAPSCYNDQPWHFVLTRHGSAAHAALLATLAAGNQAWAATAPILLLCVARERFAHDHTPNRHAWYDLGQAMGSLLVCASAHGLHAHQMAGFDAAQAARALALPPAHAAVAVCALGYLGDPARLPAGVSEKDAHARTRRPLAEFTFEARWQGSWPAPGAPRTGAS